jgi:carbamoyltransferase
MGDGGLALGAALLADIAVNGVARSRLDDLFLGPAYGRAEIERALAAFPGLKIERVPDIASRTAGLIADGKIILWFQGRMEYGPRALGGRSILALPGSAQLKTKLNIFLKKRVWYQPFCPTMLADAAAEVLEDYGGVDNRFMTVGYKVRDEYADRMVAVINADNSCRPQILRGEEGPAYACIIDLLKKVRERTGRRRLSTSFNKHGNPSSHPPQAIELPGRSPRILVRDFWHGKTEASCRPGRPDHRPPCVYFIELTRARPAHRRPQVLTPLSLAAFV